ncbi:MULTISPECIES: hypothetical protein [Yersinia]|uniref:Uncharacterized protein n=1 Tax=Yersinia intermedia TaxID=631 RepID=A0A209A1Q1_YERIN|nr:MULTISPECIES: hypothetical protein [Yersinia]EKN6173587.1 hypothetical protein [Yersinia enterocolitica]ELW8976333.1 hypothetical protein [Yersinia enterocolitica]ELZ1905074.1 hypothetical protein [Yersinia enterocolitica]MCB5311950.1 hypothetical protein [Yersinia intermedia]MCB5325324.1 hypothetical protein [Yersinia intermedia]
MIHYHGGPITPDTCAIKAWRGRHAFISFAHSSQIGLASEICQTFALDNGAFSTWKKAGKNKIDWSDYYNFVDRWKNHPGLDFAIIPDVIDGGAEENDALLAEWPHGKFAGVPVWHMNESNDRFIRLCNEYPRVAIGSCGEYDVKSPLKAVARLKDIIRHVVDVNGQPITKLHGLRMLNPTIFTRLPLASADSTNVAQNIGKDVNWKGTYQPFSKETRAAVMVERIESHNSSGTLDYCEKRDHFAVQLGLEV